MRSQIYAQSSYLALNKVMGRSEKNLKLCSVFGGGFCKDPKVLFYEGVFFILFLFLYFLPSL